MNPFYDRRARPHQQEEFTRQEVALANRNHGIALEALRYDVTPAGMHYLLTHFDIPAIDHSAFSLAVGGEVDHPLTLCLDEIRALPAITHTVTMECAGNGRAHLMPRHPSMPWFNEAVGTAEWTGTPLRNVLETAGVKEGAVDIVFFGADSGFDRGHEHIYGRSLAPEHAADGDVMLVYAMNGAPLLPQHGAPLRLIVPGWYGMASVKWLSRIEAWAKPYDGFQQVDGYQYKQNPGDEGVPVQTIRVRSLMVPPGIPDWFTRQRMAEAGSIMVEGRAWSGGGVPVSKVELGIDGIWHEAELIQSPERFAWSKWHFEWAAQPGEFTLACRAVDANGDVQPGAPRWDNSGMGNNGIHQVQVTVR
jgi:DMSO/TMAO reductase YedYZ molybdopterin-dependent catalytic subunit